MSPGGGTRRRRRSEGRLCSAPLGPTRYSGGASPARRSITKTAGQLFEEINEAIDVFGKVQKSHAAGGYFVGQGGVADGVEVVRLDRVKIERGQRAGGGQHVVARLARQAENHVDAEIQTPLAAAAIGVEKGAVIVTSAEPGQRAVVDGLQPSSTTNQVCRESSVKISKISSPNSRGGCRRSARRPGVGQCFTVCAVKLFGRAVGVGGCLKIGQKAFRPMSPPQPLDAFVELLADAGKSPPTAG